MVLKMKKYQDWTGITNRTIRIVADRYPRINPVLPQSPGCIEPIVTSGHQSDRAER